MNDNVSYPTFRINPNVHHPWHGVAWDRPKKTLKIKPGPIQGCYDLAFLPNNRLAMTDREDRTLRILDDTGSVAETYKNDAYVPCRMVSPLRELPVSMRKNSRAQNSEFIIVFKDIPS